MDFSTVNREFCAKTAGGDFGRLPDKPAVSGRGRRKRKNRYWGSVLFYKHLILGMTALAILLPLFGLTGMVYKYTCLKAEYQGLLRRANALCTAEAAKKTIKYPKSAER